jgi:hypothetical protein
MVYFLTFFLVALFGMYFGLVDFVDDQPLSALMGTDARAPIFLIALIAFAFASIIGTRRGGLAWTRALPLIFWLFAAVIDATNGFGKPSDLLGLSVSMVLGAVLIGRVGLIGASVAVVAITVIGLERNLPPDAPSQLFDVIIQYVILFIIAGFYLRTIRSQNIDASERSALERGRSIQVVDLVAQQVGQRRATDDILNTAIDQVIANYPTIYHAQVFLIDESGNDARLRASTGDVGRALLQRRHSLPVGSRSVIGQVTARGEPVIARSNTAESVHRRNEFLPDTMVEMAFPLRVGERTIGALDLQSKLPDGIQDEDIPVFQLLADTIALALDNGELFRLTQDRLRENQKLIDQLTQTGAEVQSLNVQLTQDAWARQLEAVSGRVGIEVTLGRDAAGNLTSETTPWDADYTPLMRDALDDPMPLQRATANGLLIALPIRVRGVALGALEWELPDRAPLSDDEIELATLVMERFGMLLETLRVSEENRRTAQREAVVNTIGGRLQASYDIDYLLSEAARGLQDALGARRIAIRLGTPDTAHAPLPVNGSERNGA